MRLFIGVELDDRVRGAAMDVAERLRQRLQRRAPQLEARWIDAPNLHVTVWFIGEVDEARASAIADALHPPFETPSFQLSLGGAGAFPPSGRPRVFWIAVREGGDRLAQLYREIERRLAPLGFAAERREYTAHLTIARVKDTGAAAPRAIRQAVGELSADAGSCIVSALTLFRSRLSPRGAAYEPILRVPLS